MRSETRGNVTITYSTVGKSTRIKASERIQIKVVDETGKVIFEKEAHPVKSHYPERGFTIDDQFKLAKALLEFEQVNTEPSEKKNT